ncbi:protein NDRG3 isoform X5 [Cryptotermes secundus]|nr:protein NDRG3 isoform X5 [Cryptotermes secundus]XP_023726942.1 protein NDRG3 isoform X5 [Cryptotermes secundus]XP_023726948.1 protein NDRG3 isoform X5 [Cryptotermes secundus]
MSSASVMRLDASTLVKDTASAHRRSATRMWGTSEDGIGIAVSSASASAYPQSGARSSYEHSNGNGSITAKSPTVMEGQSTMPSDCMDDIDLKNIQLQFPNTRTLSKDDSSIVEERVETGRGSVLVAVQGNRSKPAILTYHDLGLNYISNFQAFFNYIDMRALLDNFCVYHVTAPGQEEGSPTLPDDHVYPTMDELAEQINFVMSHFLLKSIIGFGVGAGGNVLARFALVHPEKVEALCLVNCVSTQAGWIEWGYQKLNARHLRTKGMTQAVLDYLMWHHFGRGTEERNHDLVQVYKAYFERHVNPTNLALFIDSYIRRTDLNIVRELEPSRRKNSHTLSMPVMNITGALSPHVDDTVTLNGRLDPTNSTWMKIQDCGMVLEEQPGKVSEAFRLFLQGQGYAVKLSRKRSTSTSAEVAPLTENKMAIFRQTSLDGLNLISKHQTRISSPPYWSTSAINITENPISEAVVC